MTRRSNTSEPGSALLTEETWERNYELIFAIEYLMAECELLTADKVAAEDRLSRLAQRARNRHDFCVATRLRLTLYTTLDRSDRCVDVFLDWLRRDGTVWSNHPTREDVMREYERIWTLLGSRQIEDLIDLPLITDPDVLDTLDVFTEIMTPSQLFDENLSFTRHLPPGDTQPRARQLRRVVFCLRLVCHVRRAAIQQLQGRLSVRPAGL